MTPAKAGLRLGIYVFKDAEDWTLPLPMTCLRDAAGGIGSGMQLGFHLLRRTAYQLSFIGEVARVMEYKAAYDHYRADVQTS